jgi:putative N-acetylmannosamine-6-phosphate epimerase
MKNTNILTIVLIIISVNFYGQSDSSKELVSKFFTNYKVNKEKAVRDLYATNKWTQVAKEGIEKVVTTVNGFTKEYMGEYSGYETISIKKISPSYELHSYLVKYGRQPIRYMFKLYKPKDKWILFSFSLDDGVDKEL